MKHLDNGITGGAETLGATGLDSSLGSKCHDGPIGVKGYVGPIEVKGDAGVPCEADAKAFLDMYQYAERYMIDAIHSMENYLIENPHTEALRDEVAHILSDMHADVEELRQKRQALVSNLSSLMKT